MISTEQDLAGVFVAVRDSGPDLDTARLDRVFVALYFSSPCPAPTANSRIRFRWVTGPQSCANALGETLFVNWLAQVAYDPVVQGASPVNIIGESGHENCRYRAVRVDEASMELEPRHDRHVDVGDQTGCFGEARGREKFGCRRKNLDSIAQRPHEPTHGLTKGPIIFNNRHQYLVHHASKAIRRPVARAASYATTVPLRIELSERMAPVCRPCPVNFGLC